jgi:hypothetical protein
MNQRGGGQTRGGYKQQQQRPQGQQQKPAVQLTLPQIDISVLAAMDAADKNNFVGNNIFGLIAQAYGEEVAPRITGMLLDESAVNFEQLLSDSAYFTGKVNEAYNLLMSVNRQPAQPTE